MKKSEPMKRLLILLIIFFLSGSAFATEYNAFQYYYKGDYKTAQPMLSKLAEANNAQALYFLGNMNLFGYGMQKNRQAGFDYMKRAAEHKSLPAQMYLGAYYLNQEKNLKEALVWLQKAADQDDARAELFTALCYLYSLDAKKKPDTARRYTIKAAQNDIPMAQYLLARMFLKSRYAGDRRMGRIWLEKAAKNRYKDAEDLLPKIQAATDKASIKTVLEATPTEPPQDKKPWDNMMALLQKAGITITNPKRALSKGDQETHMPVLESLAKNTIIVPDFNLISPSELAIQDVLEQISLRDYQQQTQQLHINLYKYTKPKSIQTYAEAFKNLSWRAMHGNDLAQFRLALLYENGLGVTVNQEKAFELFLKTAEIGYSKAEYMVGIYYLKGWGVAQDIDKAMHWLREAALHGNTHAQLLLGNIYEHGLSDTKQNKIVKREISRARAMYSLAAQSGNPLAQFQLAQMYSSGIFNPSHNHKIQQQELKIAQDLYTKAAKAGMNKARIYLAYFYAEKTAPEDKKLYAYETAKKFAENRDYAAELLLATLYDRGVGTRQNRRAAFAIYKQLAKQNSAFANFTLGTYYYLFDKNAQKAKEYLTKAVTQGINYAQYNLAIIAKNSKEPDSETLFLNLLNKAIDQGCSQAQLLLADYYLVNNSDKAAIGKAANIYQKLAAKQDPEAELKLGFMYQNGIYYSINYAKAIEWYQRAANQNNKFAQYQLGEMYLLGQGVTRNINLALRYYKKSAKHDFTPAMAAIGYIKAVDQFDYESAINWYKKAAKLNDEAAEKNLDILEKIL